MSAYALNERQGRELQRMLTDLSVQAESAIAFFSDSGGNILACESAQDNVHLETIVALAAGAFAATRELARLMGEREFQMVFHEGSTRCIFIRAVGPHFLLGVIYDREETTTGLVRLYAGRTAEEAAVVLGDVDGQCVQDAGPARFDLRADADLFGGGAEACPEGTAPAIPSRSAV